MAAKRAGVGGALFDSGLDAATYVAVVGGWRWRKRWCQPTAVERAEDGGALFDTALVTDSVDGGSAFAMCVAVG